MFYNKGRLRSSQFECLNVLNRINEDLSHHHALSFHGICSWIVLLPYVLPLYLSSVFLDNSVKGHQVRLQPSLASLSLFRASGAVHIALAFQCFSM